MDDGDCKIVDHRKVIFFTVVPAETVLCSKSLYTSPITQRKYISALHVIINVPIVQFPAWTPRHDQTTVEVK